MFAIFPSKGASILRPHPGQPKVPSTHQPPWGSAKLWIDGLSRLEWSCGGPGPVHPRLDGPQSRLSLQLPIDLVCRFVNGQDCVRYGGGVYRCLPPCTPRAARSWSFQEACDCSHCLLEEVDRFRQIHGG